MSALAFGSDWLALRELQAVAPPELAGPVAPPCMGTAEVPPEFVELVVPPWLATTATPPELDGFGASP